MSTTIPENYRDLLLAEVATLSTIGPDGRPQMSEVWFLAEGDTVSISLNSSRQKMKNLLRNPACSVLILDLGLPDIDGLDVTKRLREWASAPIIVISARGQADAIKVRGEALRLNPVFLRLKLVERWNGKSPLVVPADQNTTGAGLLLPLGAGPTSRTP